MKKTSIILVGSSGRMGREIAVCLDDHKSAQYFAGVDKSGFENTPELAQVKNKKDHVVLDFSSPAGLADAVNWCVKHKVALVSGTTGLSAQDHQRLEKAAKVIPVIWSPNMSIGVQLFKKMIQAVGASAAAYDLQIEEFHHKRKKDAPSGTGKYLQTVSEKAFGKKLPAVLSGRGGGIFGIHKLWLMEEEEIITIEHTALNRRVFARGAVQAAIWLKNKKPGYYDFSEVLGG